MQTLAQLKTGAYKGAASLRLSENLEIFPREIFDLADTLELLDVSGNLLNELPSDFGRFKKLKTFFASDNKFTRLPEVLADSPELDIVGFKANQIAEVPAKAINPNIRWLILTNNRIASIPAEIGHCTRLQKLMLAGNRLTSLPQELSYCKNLGLLRIAANKLTELPDWLLQMPRLAWLAISGNPFCSYLADSTTMPLIDWASLALHEVLGQGASGIIYKATYTSGSSTRMVAVKLFKGEVTSDGLPEDEMKACIAVGNHPGLVTLIGQITGHPDGKKGLVMELIPERFYNLGIAPSFESCTRDVYKPDFKLSEQQIIGIAKTIASVGRHLHERGIMHSDLYAHNTLIDKDGETLFGDFGAACVYDKYNIALATRLERLEVLAFGYMLDDLVTVAENPNSASILEIASLRDKCLSEVVLDRPDFATLDSVLPRL